MTLSAAHLSPLVAKIPSPSKAQYHLGPIPIRMYALCILAGILVAVWLGDKRWQARGGKPQEVVDIAIWAVPFGLVGGRLYHVITTSGPYFGKDGDWVKAFYVWQGGLGIWGAIALGALGAYIGCRRHGVSLRTFADAVAPGIVLAQAIGRWGNWFNNELYGKPTTMPWGLQVHVMDPSTQSAILGPDGKPTVLPDLYQPTFLYESLWCVGVAALVIWADRRFTLGYGRAFALYVAAYTVGRGWIEYLRIDEAHHFLGLRLNDWTAIVVFLGAVVYFVRSAKQNPGRESTPYLAPQPASDGPAADAVEPEPKAEAGTEAETEAVSEAEASPEAKAEPEPKAEPEAEPKAKAAPEAKPEPVAKPEAAETPEGEPASHDEAAGGADAIEADTLEAEAPESPSADDPHADPAAGRAEASADDDEAAPALTPAARKPDKDTEGASRESST